MINLKKFKKNEQSDLEKEIARLFETLNGMNPEDEDYAATADRLNTLYRLKEIDSKRKVSPDALVSLAGSLGGILLVLYYEHANVIRSKAFSFIKNIKV